MKKLLILLLLGVVFISGCVRPDSGVTFENDCDARLPSPCYSDSEYYRNMNLSNCCEFLENNEVCRDDERFKEWTSECKEEINIEKKISQTDFDCSKEIEPIYEKNEYIETLPINPDSYYGIYNKRIPKEDIVKYKCNDWFSIKNISCSGWYDEGEGELDCFEFDCTNRKYCICDITRVKEEMVNQEEYEMYRNICVWNEWENPNYKK